MRNIIRILGSAALLSLPIVGVNVLAATPEQPTLKTEIKTAKAACDADIKKVCGDVTPGEGRLVECLESKEDKVSDGCNSARQKLAASISNRLDKAEVAFRKDCGGDVQKFCANIPSGKGRLLDCLNQNEDGLSNSCKNFQSKVDKKLDKALG